MPKTKEAADSPIDAFVLSHLEQNEIQQVELADRSYSVIVGDGAVHELGSLIPAKAKRAAIVTQANTALEAAAARVPETAAAASGSH